MADYSATKLIEIAKKEVGYLEKKSNSQLDNKTANAGSANWTKYGAWYGLNPAAWCAIFVSWCFGQLTGSKKGAQDMLCGFLYASCTSMYNTFKKAGRVYTTPKVGDIIVFNKTAGSSTMAHTGLVTKITSTRVYTIEGNTSTSVGVVANGGGVAEKSYPLNHKRIGAYLRPTYTEETKSEEKTMATVNITPYQLQKGDTGNAVKCLQRCLKGFGFDCGTIDGDFGPKTDSAVRKLQTEYKIDVDGIAGKQTWSIITGSN